MFHPLDDALAAVKKEHAEAELQLVYFSEQATYVAQQRAFFERKAADLRKAAMSIERVVSNYKEV